jgi:alpha/beta superfamily hydrolase
MERDMEERQVSFKSGTLTLEGLIAPSRTHEPVRGAVVCHPHPLYGGSMYNNVVEAMLEAMWRLGWATLRFNFRGVGQSEGEHGGGQAEADDVCAAIDFLSSQPGVKKDPVLSGYSFGAMASVKALAQIPQLSGLLLTALPLRMADLTAVERFSKPSILVAGDHDMYCPASELKVLHQKLAHAHIAIIEGADHFFGGYEDELTAALVPLLGSLT